MLRITMCFQLMPAKTNRMEGIWFRFIFPLQEQQEHEAITPGVYCVSAMVERLSLRTDLEGQHRYPWKPEGYVWFLYPHRALFACPAGTYSD